MSITLVDFVNQTQDQKKKSLVMKVTNESVFMRVLSFIPVDGQSYHYAEQATLGGIAFRSVNESYSADAGVVNPKVENLAILGGEVRTDAQLANKQGGIARSNAILAKTRKAGLVFDRAVVKGDTATNAKSFDGLNKRLTGNQVITAGANGAQLTRAMVDTLIDRVVGPNSRKVLVMNKEMRRKLKNLVLAEAGGASVLDVNGSFGSYDGVHIEILDEDGDELPILAFDESQGTDAATGSMYCCMPGGVGGVDGEYMQGLISNEMVQQYASGMQGVMHVDIVEMNAGLALFHGRSAARIKGIKIPV